MFLQTYFILTKLVKIIFHKDTNNKDGAFTVTF